MNLTGACMALSVDRFSVCFLVEVVFYFCAVANLMLCRRLQTALRGHGQGQIWTLHRALATDQPSGDIPVSKAEEFEPSGLPLAQRCKVSMSWAVLCSICACM